MGRLRGLAAVLTVTSALALASCSRGMAGPDGPGDRDPLPERGEVLWRADHETGDLSQWTAGQGEAVFNTGTGSVEVVTVDHAVSGSHALALRIDGSEGGVNAARIFRWARTPASGFYGAYLYFQEPVPTSSWWNVMQVKSPAEADDTLPTWVVNVAVTDDGLRLYLWDAIEEVSHPSWEALADVVVPLGQWVHVEMYVQRSTGTDGRVALWQDGVLLFDLPGVRTGVTDELQWSINNYTDAQTPGPVLLLADDATIRAAAGADQRERSE